MGYDWSVFLVLCISRSGLEQDDMRILYKYLTTSLFPRHSEPEVRGEGAGVAMWPSVSTVHAQHLAISQVIHFKRGNVHMHCEKCEFDSYHLTNPFKTWPPSFPLVRLSPAGRQGLCSQAGGLREPAALWTVSANPPPRPAWTGPRLVLCV